MRLDPMRRVRSWILVGCAVAAMGGLGIASAGAQNRDDLVTDAPQASPSANPPRGGKHALRSIRREADPQAGHYFVEFRSRYALSYGHTFLVHGRLNASGQVGQVTADQVAGLHPAGDGPQLWSVGHVVPVPAETGPSDGDMEDEYISNRFRVLLTEAQYRRVAAYIRRKQNTPTMWHAVLYNCNKWVGEVAQYMGLDAPENTLLYPSDYISALRKVNASKVPEPEYSAHRAQ